MPRVTRAVSRRNHIHDIKDPTNLPHTSPIGALNQISTFGSTRNTLGEITGNHDYTQLSLEQASILALTHPTDDTAKNNPRVTSVQAKRSRSIKDLVNPEELGIKIFRNTFLGVDRADIQTQHIVPPDPMSQVIEEQIASKSHPSWLTRSQITRTPRFDPAVHKSPVKEELIGEDEDEDSFVQTIISRSPFKSNKQDKWANPTARSMSSVSHSQAGNYQDIEDPLDAIDALEDALEQIGQALPVVEEHGLDSPVRPGTPADQIHVSLSNGADMASKKHSAALQSQRNEDEQRSRRREAKLSLPPSQSLKSRQSSVARSRKSSDRCVSKSARSISTDSRPGPIHKSMARKSSHPNLPTNTTSTPTSRTSKVNPHSTIINSISKPGFTPSKSTKPPTRPTFELPGEAISKRQKAQREERLKREAEELQRRREFKARAPRNYSTPSFPVKETVSSRSRATLNVEEAQNVNNLRENSKSPPSLHTTRSSSLMSTRAASLRTAVTGNNAYSRTQPETKAAGKSKTIPPSTPARSANISLKNGGSGSNGSPTKDHDINHGDASPVSSSRTLTMTTTSSPRTTESTLLVQRSRGKEIFARDRIHEIERDRERREKEEAAKRARTEAAERGRMASREWAEKQKQKLKLARKNLTEMG
ncbi:hypothetical protein AJ78_00769 [Emergomyces pasteurianus Ep9510]|uniref:Carboxylesterase family protein n=1 Tax=Emergomyces pasteurianus Ep9510 TaxID=1447872 RepID=A0A1J9QSR0_9EURO|nr:hypothetical protein AJ78_00769 [Emergomyces pasteurianus Ep9510]